MARRYIWFWLLLLFVLGVLWYLSKNTNQDMPGDKINEGIACTMEAKMCPDGSYVGRSGPNCEFSPCPGF